MTTADVSADMSQLSETRLVARVSMESWYGKVPVLRTVLKSSTKNRRLRGTDGVVFGPKWLQFMPQGAIRYKLPSGNRAAIATADENTFVDLAVKQECCTLASRLVSIPGRA